MRLNFIDLKKAFNSVEIEAVMEALNNDSMATLGVRIFRELYSYFTTTTGISPFCSDITVYVTIAV